ncbi:hypothetical protein ACLKA7_006234 [Drosophila subpalustris]
MVDAALATINAAARTDCAAIIAKLDASSVPPASAAMAAAWATRSANAMMATKVVTVDVALQIVHIERYSGPQRTRIEMSHVKYITI